MAARSESARELPSSLRIRHQERGDGEAVTAHVAANGHADGNADRVAERENDTLLSAGNPTISMPIPAYRPPLQDRSLLPDGKHSLSGIAARAAAMGLGVGIGLTCAVILAWFDNAIWRAPFFIASLSLFHFLEFWTTAQFNTPLATPTAFLLTSNGMAYNVAHMSALLEVVLVQSGFLGRVTGISSWDVFRAIMAPALGYIGCNIKEEEQLSQLLRCVWLALGFGLLAVGQIARSLAMATAGRSFNHTVQVYRRQEHSLVTTGIYAYLRHPSYFGFYWWALGTQMVCGNKLCLLAYVVVLWRFFQSRISKEEKYLISFFGKEYTDYRGKTSVGIPGIP